MADIKDIDLNLLRVLDVLLEEQNVSRAAKRLALTQPTVSGMLSRLRQMLDDPLFIRAQRGLVPTERALALQGPLKSVLEGVQALLVPEAFSPQTVEATLAICAMDYAQYVIVAPWVERLRKEAPGLRLSLLPYDRTPLEERLARREVDFALTTLELSPASLQSLRLFDEQYVGAVHHRSRDVKDTMSLKQFCQFDHIIVSVEGGGFRGPVDRALAQKKKRRRVVLSVPNFLLLPRMLQADRLMAVGPKRLLADFSAWVRLVKLPISVPGFTMILVWHPRTQDSPLHRWFREWVARPDRSV